MAPPEPEDSPRAGWHRIASWMAPLAFGDELTLTRAQSESSWSRTWASDAPKPTPIDWPIERDLIGRAHAALQSETGEPLPVAAELVKRTPAGSGLGGGSSDAAAMLAGLNELFALGLTPASLRAIGGQLGSDVPFFIDDGRVPRPAVVSGFGSEIERSQQLTGDVTLLIPGASCSTPAVYRAFDEDAPRGFREPDVRRHAAEASPGSADLFNDLHAAAMRVEPGLAGVAGAVPGAMLTGSGSAFFLLGHPPVDAPAGTRVVRTSFLGARG